MGMTDADIKHGHPRTFGFMRRSECDAIASGVANVPVEAWEAPDGTILVWPAGRTPRVLRALVSQPGPHRYVYNALDSE